MKNLLMTILFAHFNTLARVLAKHSIVNNAAQNTILGVDIDANALIYRPGCVSAAVAL